MGIRQNGPLGLGLHLDDQFGVPPRNSMLSNRLVMPGPIGRLVDHHAGPLGLAVDLLSPKAPAKAMVKAFASRVGGGKFVHITRAQVARGLLERVEWPYRIAQADTSLCGPAALMVGLATRDPVRYVHLVIDLFEHGTATMGTLKITPGKDLLEYDPADTVDPADWIPLASLRDSDNWFLDYQSTNGLLSAMTLPHSIVRWFRNIGFARVVDETNLVATKDEKSIKDAARFYHDDFWVCLFVNDQILDSDSQEDRSLLPNHWIVLTSDVTVSRSGVSMTVFSWGVGHRSIPERPTRPLSIDHLLRNYYGFVAAGY